MCCWSGPLASQAGVPLRPLLIPLPPTNPMQALTVLGMIGTVMSFNHQLALFFHSGRWLACSTDEPKGQLQVCVCVACVRCA